MKLFSSFRTQRATDRLALIYRDLIRREAKIGSGLFQAPTRGGRREFFCLDDRTWVWHEEWLDQTGQRHVVTTRYDVRPNGILKAQDGQGYRYIDASEAKNLYAAICLYNQRISTELYGVAA
jgi:hypothetical protein